MRVVLRQPSITVTPGRPVTIEVEVTNTLAAIDGLSARVTGPEGVTTISDPPLLPLFPDTTGRLTLKVMFPALLPAGPHHAQVQVLSAVEPDRPESVPLDVTVLSQPAATLTILPPLRSGHHGVRYTVRCDNIGNTTLEVALAALDPNRTVRTKFTPSLLPVGPGQSGSAQLHVKGRRHLLGGDVNHAIKVLASAPDIEIEDQARFRQKPLIPRGVRTALVLGIIVGLWAAAFLFGLGKAFNSDPQTKAVPPSFYSASKVKAGGAALGLIVGLPGELPAGAVPKNGVVEGVGGSISGTVVAASTGQGVGRITIEAKRDTPSGSVLVSSDASQADGSFSLAGLLPGMYKLHFTASGFQDLWYPAGTSEADATPVEVQAVSVTSLDKATIVGMPGSITGSVDTGLPSPIPVVVIITPEQGTTSGPIGNVTTDATGRYNVNNLPTPGTYDLSFSAQGYQAASDVEQLGGGDKRIANTVRLTAAGGEIDGLVTDGVNPLGGVAITANANGQTVTSATPTSGAIGHFAIPGLATPATYLLTFTKAGFGTKTVSVLLGPGKVDNNLTISMVGGTGMVTGTVFGPLAAGASPVSLGGVTVTVNGGPSPVTTQTLTGGAIGSYVVSGLVTPGNYTVTFAKGGYASLTVPVILTSSGSAIGVNVTLSLSVGVIQGRVRCIVAPPATTTTTTDPCPASGILGGVTVSVTNGNTTEVRTTVTAATPTAGANPTTFTMPGLPAGAYSVTFTAAGFAPQTHFVQLPPGQPVYLDITMVPSS